MRLCREVRNGSTVFLRAGMDVPIQDGRIIDPDRIEEIRPTIDLLRSKNCKILIAIKLGRPQGGDLAYSTKSIAEYLAAHYPTRFVPEVVGEQVRAAVIAAQPGELVVSENLFFDERELSNNEEFAQQLVAGCDCIVQEAYTSAHRAQASIVAVNHYLPAYAGLLLEQEILGLQPFLNPQHPVVAIIGGAKADKLGTIRGLLPKLDLVLIGGALANTFLKAAGFSVGQSKVDETGLAEASELYKTGKIILPVDAVVAENFARDARQQTFDIGAISSGMILDIGPKTVERYATYLNSARTIIWAGPIGVFEWDAFAGGTRAIAKIVAEATDRGALSLAAGGDSGAALVALGYNNRITHISTGGGVTLELLEGHALPGVIALEENMERFPN